MKPSEKNVPRATTEKGGLQTCMALFTSKSVTPSAQKDDDESLNIGA